MGRISAIITSKNSYMRQKWLNVAWPISCGKSCRAHEGTRRKEGEAGTATAAATAAVEARQNVETRRENYISYIRERADIPLLRSHYTPESTTIARAATTTTAPGWTRARVYIPHAVRARVAERAANPYVYRTKFSPPLMLACHFRFRALGGYARTSQPSGKQLSSTIHV
uniref:Uncharacterized protein n=1 Tax=Trichogramma kaykai TaxID=54128 RepID=A0ABD2VUY8_9HYME